MNDQIPTEALEAIISGCDAANPKSTVQWQAALDALWANVDSWLQSSPVTLRRSIAESQRPQREHIARLSPEVVRAMATELLAYRRAEPVRTLTTAREQDERLEAAIAELGLEWAEDDAGDKRLVDPVAEHFAAKALAANAAREQAERERDEANRRSEFRLNLVEQADEDLEVAEAELAAARQALPEEYRTWDSLANAIDAARQAAESRATALEEGMCCLVQAIDNDTGAEPSKSMFDRALDNARDLIADPDALPPQELR